MNEITETLSRITIGSFSLLSLLSIVLIFLVSLIVIKIILRIIDRILDASKLDAGVKSFVRSTVKCVLWVVVIIIIADRLGIDTTSLIALLSVAGLALSLSVQGVMTNLFSGITILTTKPFVAGDYVELDGASGTVKDVKLFYTSVVTIDNKIIHIPNGQVTGAKIINYSSQDKRRVDLVFSASYDDATHDVKDALLAAINADSRIIYEPAKPFVGLLAYKESSIEYVVRAWVATEDYWDVYFSLNEKVREVFNERGIQMTYEHLNVHIIQ